MVRGGERMGRLGLCAIVLSALLVLFSEVARADEDDVPATIRERVAEAEALEAGARAQRADPPFAAPRRGAAGGAYGHR